MNAIFLLLEYEPLKIAEGGIWLDKPCDCDEDNRANCAKCKGSGFCLTESGEKIMQFLKRHYSCYEPLVMPPMVRG